MAKRPREAPEDEERLLSDAKKAAALARATEVFARHAPVVVNRAKKLARPFAGTRRGRTAAARAARILSADVSAAKLRSGLRKAGYVIGRLPKPLQYGLGGRMSANLTAFLEALPKTADAPESLPAAAMPPVLAPIHNGKKIATVRRGKLVTHVGKKTRLTVVRSLYYQALAAMSPQSGESRVKAIYDYILRKLEEAFPGQLEFLEGCSSFLLSLVDKDEQTEHTDGDAQTNDAKEHAERVENTKAGEVAPSVSIIVPLSGTVRLRVWPGSHSLVRKMVLDEDYEGDISNSVVISVNVGEYVVFVHDFVHAGMAYSVKNLRLHIFGDSKRVKRQEGAAYRMVDIVSPLQAKCFRV